MPKFHSLTAAQRRYLESFICDIPDAMRVVDDEDAFVGMLSNTNFDGNAVSSEVRMAMRLEAAGLLKDVDNHGKGLPYGGLSVTFTQEGAKALCRVARNAIKTRMFVGKPDRCVRRV